MFPSSGRGHQGYERLDVKVATYSAGDHLGKEALEILSRRNQPRRVFDTDFTSVDAVYDEGRLLQSLQRCFETVRLTRITVTLSLAQAK